MLPQHKYRMSIRAYINLVEAAQAASTINAVDQQIIDEAPLADFGTFGDLDKEGSMRSDDLRAIKSEKWLTKVKSQFANFPHPLNVYLYNGEGGEVWIGNNKVNARELEHLNKYSGLQTLDTVRGLIGKTPPDAENSITAILIENEGDGRIPLTPWILAHRIGHAIVDAGMGATKDHDIQMNYLNADEIFREILRSTKSRLSAVDEFENHFLDISDRSSEDAKRVAVLIGTMRSARTGNYTNGGEFFIELMAQVMTQGRVIFRMPPTPSDPQYGVKVGERLQRQAEDLTAAINALFAACVGKVVLL
jgi:hypothetical protein